MVKAARYRACASRTAATALADFLRLHFYSPIFGISRQSKLWLVQTFPLDFGRNPQFDDGIHQFESDERHRKRINRTQCRATELDKELLCIAIKQSGDALTSRAKIRRGADAVPSGTVCPVGKDTNSNGTKPAAEAVHRNCAARI